MTQYIPNLQGAISGATSFDASSSIAPVNTGGTVRQGINWTALAVVAIAGVFILIATKR